MTPDNENTKARILIVEDEVLIAYGLASNLKGAGYCLCGEATSAEMAFDLIERDPPDLVLMDIVLQGEMDGIEAAEKIKTKWGIPVIFLTAFADRDRLDRAKLTYPFGYILKPFQIREVKITIEMALYMAKVDAERRKIESALKEREVHLKEAQHIAHLGSWERDLTKDKLFWSDETKRILGFKEEEEITYEKFMDCIYEDDKERLISAQKEAMAGVKPLDLEYRLVRPNGELRYVYEKSMSIFDGDGNLVRLSGIVLDLTERKRAEEEKIKLQVQLHQAHKMEAIGTLAGGIAHDFNNLFQAINGYAEILLMDKNENDPEYRNLKAIQTVGARAAGLVRQLLLFSRKMETNRRPVELNRELEHARGILERTLLKMIDIKVHFGDHLWAINADPAQMEQILFKLGINAAAAMPDGGSLVIKTENIILEKDYAWYHLGAQPGRYVLLTVADTGHGMDRDTVEKIFEPFFTTKAIGKGTGLGLASVYGIVKGHGGYITCDSMVGQGTTFKIYLPAIEPAQPVEAIDLVVQSPRGGTERILLADDEKPIRDMVTPLLIKYGYTVLTASSGEEALETYSHKPSEIDLVILDLGMQGMGGYKCLQEIIQINPSAKVLIASGYSINEQVKKTLAAGASEYIGKPYELNDLLGRIRAVLDKKK
ncbi:MAG: response regulator [Thermodesulfobacteriota bacterium]